MSRSTRETLWTLTYIAAGLTAAGLSWKLLSLRPVTGIPLLPFIILGVAGGLIYAAVRLRGIGYAIMMVILLFFLQLALTPPLRVEAAIRAAFWAGPVGASFVLAGYSFKVLNRIPIGKFLLMALLTGAGHLVVVLLFRMHTEAGLPTRLLLRQFLVGTLFGAILGIIIELIEIAFSKRQHPTTFEPPAR